MFLLVRVTRALNENHFVRGGGRHVRIYVAQKFRRVAFREIVVSADNQRARVRYLLKLREIVRVVQNAAQPIVRRVRRANNPAHERERQNFFAVAVADNFFDEIFFARRHAAHHVRQIRGTHQNKFFDALRVVVRRQIMNNFVRAE